MKSPCNKEGLGSPLLALERTSWGVFATNAPFVLLLALNPLRFESGLGRIVPFAAALLVFGIAAVDAQAPIGNPIPVTGQMTLPHDLSPWGMFMGADFVVKGVLIGLVFASVVTWTVAVAKFIEIAGASSSARRAGIGLRAVDNLTEAKEQLGKARGVIPDLAQAAVEEVQRSGMALSAEGIKERIASRFQRIEAAEMRRMLRGTGVLATIGATAPFVGLFGTVWGIMNSFIGISKAHTTNLAVVAPGIAEALLATAVGLIAAIPAVMIYNVFSRALAGYRARVGDASAEIMRAVSRDLDRHQTATTGHPASSRPRLAAAHLAAE